MENTAKGLETKKYINSFPNVIFVALLASRCGCIPYRFCSNENSIQKDLESPAKFLETILIHLFLFSSLIFGASSR